ncbi:MAG TPA: helix-turn-helix domain-containing protein [Pyrinomonadaceae bacterium]
MIKIQIKKLLKARGETLYWLAQETGVTYVALYNLKTGKSQGIRYPVLEAICEALECEPGDLLKRAKARKGATKKGRKGR